MSDTTIHKCEPEIIPPVHMLSREEILQVLSEIIRECCRKTTNGGRIRDPQADTVRISYMRSAIYAGATALSGLRDLQLDEIEKRLLKLEEGNHDKL